MTLKFERKSELKTRIGQVKVRDAIKPAILTLLILCCMGMTYYCHFIMRTELVFTHLFYVPVVLASFWFVRKGILISLFLAGWLLASHSLSGLGFLHMHDFMRLAILISIALVVAMLREQSLKTERKFKDLIETIADWVWEIDAREAYTYASPKIKDLLGYEVSEVLGKTPFDLMSSEEAERVGKFFREKVINKEPFYGLENVNLHKDGHLVVLETNGIPIFDKKGGLKGYRGIDRDITESKTAEELGRELERKNREKTLGLSVLYELSGQIGHTLDYRQLFELILSSLYKVVKYDICAYSLVKDSSVDLTIRPARSVDSKNIDQAKEILLHAFKQISGVRVDERNLTLKVETIEELVKDRPPLMKGEIRSFFNAPLIIRGKTRGMLHISSLKQDAFTEEHIRLLYTNANQSSAAMERLETVLETEKSKTETVIKSMADGVIMIDQNREVIVVNPAAKKALHIDSHECETFECISKLLGYDPLELLRKEERNSVKKEVSIYDMDYQVQASCVIGSDKELIGTVIALRDVSREKKIDRMKSEFISIVGHELRTPLTSIKNAVNIIFSKKAGDITENQIKFLSMADRNINRLSGIINDLLDVSRIDSGKIKIELESLDLCNPLDMAITSLSPGAGGKSISIRKEIPSDLSKAYGDSDKLEQIFINLLGNAIKFTPGGGRICVSASEVQGEDFIKISVTDTGIGIGPDEIEKIFDRFYQVEKTLTRGIQGTGLGLSIVKGLGEAHGGKIWVESKVGKGSKFVFTLPRYSPERVFKDCLDREIVEAREKGTPLSLIMLKIEEFEYLNEAYGEADVFHMLDEFKQIVQDTARRSTDRLQIQLGGGVMILLDTSKEGAIALAHRLKDALSKQTFGMKKPVRITVATGLATYPEDGVTREELMKKVQSESS